MLKYYKKGMPKEPILGLVRLQDDRVEHYDGNETWNAEWAGAGKAYMDIIGMGGNWYMYDEIDLEQVEDIKRIVDERYKERALFAYKNSDPNALTP
jgi:hypothetical protein